MFFRYIGSYQNVVKSCLVNFTPFKFLAMHMSCKTSNPSAISSANPCYPIAFTTFVRVWTCCVEYVVFLESKVSEKVLYICIHFTVCVCVCACVHACVHACTDYQNMQHYCFSVQQYLTKLKLFAYSGIVAWTVAWITDGSCLFIKNQKLLHSRSVTFQWSIIDLHHWMVGVGGGGQLMIQEVFI